jgi:hypothetical protein
VEASTPFPCLLWSAEGAVYEEKRVVTRISAYLVWSNSWTLAFTFDTRELNVRLPATKRGEALR